MLKHFYAAESDVPENLKGAYVAKHGRYELDELSKDVPVVATRLSLETDQANLKEDLRKANDKITRLETKQVPAGKVAVDIDVAERGETVKAAGLTKEEFANLKTENDAYKTLGKPEDLKAKVEGYDILKAETKNIVRDKALIAAGVTELDKARKFKTYDELDLEAKTKDGKEIFYRVTKDDKGKESKVVFDAEALKSDAFKDDLGSLLGSQKSGTRMIRQGTNTDAANKFDAIRENVKNQNKLPRSKLTGY